MQRYFYAQIDDNNGVVAMLDTDQQSDYDMLIPIRQSDYKPQILNATYTGLDDEGYGVFEYV